MAAHVSSMDACELTKAALTERAEAAKAGIELTKHIDIEPGIDRALPRAFESKHVGSLVTLERRSKGGFIISMDKIASLCGIRVQVHRDWIRLTADLEAALLGTDTGLEVCSVSTDEVELLHLQSRQVHRLPNPVVERSEVVVGLREKPVNEPRVAIKFGDQFWKRCLPHMGWWEAQRLDARPVPSR